MTYEQLQHERNFEQNTLVWLNENLTDGEDLNQMKLKLRQIINYIRIFENVDECVDYMSSNDNEQIYFLVSGSLADITVPLIYEMVQIKMIYIFCVNRQYYGKLTQKLNKINGIFTDLTMLCDTLQGDILANKTTTSSGYNSSILLLSVLPSSASDRSNRQEAAFMYFRLLAELLVGLEHKQSTKNEFISLCRSQYHGNTSELEKIEEFSRTYSKNHAIRWYTRDSFLYRIMNNALRTQDIDILFKLGFFIADLYKQLECLHLEQSKSMMLPSVVYRGQFMTKDELDNKIRTNIGGFLSINSFFSTSASKQVASMFAGHSSSNDADIESVLFEIRIDIKKCRRPIADIKRMSYMEEEDEILFSMAAVFRIESVQRLCSEDIWTVRLVMNGEEDGELNSVANSIKDELGHSDGLNAFGGLLMKMGDFQKAEHYFLMLIKDKQLDDSCGMAEYYSNLALVYNDQRNFDTAICWAEKALQLLPTNLNTLAAIYTNLGYFNVNKGNTDQALNYFHKTINIYKNILPSDHPKLAPTYINLGLLHEKQESFPEALEYFFKVIAIYQNSLPANHPQFANVYCHVGIIYLSQGNFDAALFYLLKTLEIQQKSLPTKHPHLVYTYANLAATYLKQSNDVEAYNLSQKALEIIGSSLNHPAIAVLMYTVGHVHQRKNNLSEALTCFLKALDAQIQLTSPDHLLTIRIYNNLGSLYMHQKDWIKMIDYYQRAIPIAHTCHHGDLVLFYNLVSYGYSMIKDYERASQYVELALNVGRNTLSADHHYIQIAEEHQVMLKQLQDIRFENSEMSRSRNQTK